MLPLICRVYLRIISGFLKILLVEESQTFARLLKLWSLNKKNGVSPLNKKCRLSFSFKFKSVSSKSLRRFFNACWSQVVFPLAKLLRISKNQKNKVPTYLLINYDREKIKTSIIGFTVATSFSFPVICMVIQYALKFTSNLLNLLFIRHRRVHIV